MLSDSETAKDGLSKAPETRDKYEIAIDFTVKVVNVFLAHVLGTERVSIGGGSGDLKALLDGLGCVSLSDSNGAAGEDSSVRAGEPDKEVEDLRVKVQDLERQLCAVQRQIQMQGEVSKLTVALDDRIEEIARDCESRLSDVRSHVSAVSEDVVRLNREVSERASTEDMSTLLEDVLRLKESERRHEGRISGVERAIEAERVLRDEIKDEIKRLDTATKTVQWHHKDIVYDASKPLEGIIADLTRECGGSVHKNGLVEVTASSVLGTGYEPENAVDLGTKSLFVSKDEPNQWLRYDFKGRRVTPTGYSIRTHDGPSFPKSWVLEVSNDGTDGSWEVVDRHDDNFDVKAPSVPCNFATNAPPSRSFRFVRFRLTPKTHSGRDRLHVPALELFGTLYSQ